ncbi:Heterokaryon incompatibility protein [Paramyrothecium foliicola]|nr:Heterokaryon incompatibility protein [Paramyrothecium foliicola]
MTRRRLQAEVPETHPSYQKRLDFISLSNPDEIRSNLNKRKIRQHVMKDIGLSRRKQRLHGECKAQVKPAAMHKVQLGQDRSSELGFMTEMGEEQSTMMAVPPPGSDVMLSSPTEIRAQMMTGFLFRRNSALCLKVRELCFSLALFDDGVYCLALAEKALHGAGTTYYSFPQQENTTSLGYYDQSVTHINRHMRCLEMPEASSPGVIGAVVGLASYDISESHLAPGLPKEALVSRFPSVNFHALVRKRPTEAVVTPHTLGLMEDAKAGLIPAREDDVPWIKPKSANPLMDRPWLLADGIASMVAQSEDIGGGFTMTWPASDSDSDDDWVGDGPAVQTGSRIKRGIRKLFSRKSTAPARPPASIQQRAPAQQQQGPSPIPLRRQANRPKFQWGNDVGNYVALSYEWGEGPAAHQILVKHDSITKANANIGTDAEFLPFYIRKNLHAALRRLRVMPQFIDGCYLWADAICINQESPDEKDEQMKIMSDIYQRAGNVLVWLGEGHEQLYQAVDLVQEFAMFYRTEYQEAFDDTNPYLASLHREQAAVSLKLSLETFISWARKSDPALVFTRNEATLLGDFFALTYWRRLWMVQELVMGTADMALLLGERVTEWRYVRDTAFVLAAIGDVFAQVLSGVRGAGYIDIHNTVLHIAKIAQLEIDTHRIYIPRIGGMADIDLSHSVGTRLNSGPTSGPQRGNVLWQVYKIMSYAKCSDPKDRVFGILKLPCLPSLGIEHDSKKPLVKVYGEFMAACVGFSGEESLDYLCLVDGATDELIEYKLETDGTKTEVGRERLPSFVPDLSAGRETGIIEGTFRAGHKYHPFQAVGWRTSDDVNPVLSLSKDRKLSIRGFVIDVVDGLGGIIALDPDSLNPQFKPELVQPTKSPPWPLDRTTQRAAIASCFSAGTDENGAYLRYNHEHSGFLESFVNNERSLDPSLHFMAANAELRVGGVPLLEYLPNWHGTSAQSDAENPSTRALRQTMAVRTKRKRLMISERGFLGLVPNSVNVGDVIIVLVGHGRPIVASKMLGTHGSSAYRMKGEAYVEGIMLGEMMEDEYVKELEDLVFI